MLNDNLTVMEYSLRILNKHIVRSFVHMIVARKLCSHFPINRLVIKAREAVFLVLAPGLDVVQCCEQFCEGPCP